MVVIDIKILSNYFKSLIISGIFIILFNAGIKTVQT